MCYNLSGHLITKKLDGHKLDILELHYKYKERKHNFKTKVNEVYIYIYFYIVWTKITILSINRLFIENDQRVEDLFIYIQ